MKPLPGKLSGPLISLVVLVVGVLLFGSSSLASTGAASYNLVITQASGSTFANGSSMIDFTVHNGGPDSVAMNSSIPNLSFLAGPGSITPQTLGPNQTANGRFEFGTIPAFNGVNDTVQVVSPSAFNAPNFTLDFAFRYTTRPAQAQMILGKGWANMQDSFFFFTNPATHELNDFVIYSGGVRYEMAFGSPLSPGIWNEITYVVNGSTVQLYINGQSSELWTGIGTFHGNNEPLLIGACGCGGEYFDGSIAFLRYYNRPLTAAEVARNVAEPTAPVENGLVTDLQFASLTGLSVLDSSGNGNNGVVHGGFAWVPVVPSDSTCVIEVAYVTSAGNFYLSDRTVRI